MIAGTSRRRVLPRLAAAALALLAATMALVPVAVAQTATAARPAAIEVNSRPIGYFSHGEPSRVRFGSLEFVSGLVLTSSFRGFGGLSALRVDPRGERFVAVSDKGTWFTGRFVYRGRQLAGLAEVTAAPVLGPDGGPIARRGWYDTESLAIDGDTAYIGIERVNHILKFPAFGRDGVRAYGEPISAPPALRRLPFNKGLEALVVVPRALPLGGTLLAISERGLDAAGNIQAFMIGGPSPGEFSVRRRDDYDVSDVAVLPSGSLLLLERKFSIFSGVGIRIRRIPLAGVVPGAVVDGPAIFEADLGYEVDNMEGLDVHETAAGDTILTMVSDDNFSLLQRTLLLQFKLVDP
ncbi:esterase-like activity of phytase family protein [Bradyrhizobium sp. U87765 SZCCT0131]|uniref:esterase-like activity of phytase family protein n=1 Tax=unclassified Bradyrhizobium TaxID=2631580 RepID=UPI001BA724C3|nr:MULTISPECIES: esterase-like activity of phytase family protein [unclassified Bradyrhizobium]MBR1217143.1 esterase-like activity of phytase family protein [Bradyrhizobium sp. U87765 SZCCT0131]MBR1259101.1 esterase-like activity of phytase family protein [Bradyrhizobium sp. U87765 SZCCT0134]MBR1305242.1 esterase-like activity of phytase family protein [Bradyrhizobium sp. U87765 SZCCT0110]MBR1321028.1 esterase-like activity of phytase family protein [Bradyrhizobium sp. U87765 SZCCT0109]MBR1350